MNLGTELLYPANNMIRLTVLYNLQPFVDEDEFLEWRMGEHEESNNSRPGVMRTSFSIAKTGYALDSAPEYKFITTADWPDMATFTADFHDPEYQVKMDEWKKMLKDPLFIVSEIMLESEALTEKQ